jgi:hypothetical protein
MISANFRFGPKGVLVGSNSYNILIAVISVFLGISVPATLIAEEPPAASAAFTSQDKVVLEARNLARTGDFLSAERTLSQKDLESDAQARQARLELIDILRRIRFEYSLDSAGLLAKVKKTIPDASGDEVERWASESRVRFRTIDGKKYFFRREPQNIFLFSQEAIDRRARAGNAPPATTWRLTDHLAAVVAEADRSATPEVLPVKHRFSHTITIRGNHPKIKKGSTIRVWMPLAQEYRQQRDVKLLSASPKPKMVAPNGIDGNPVSGAAQRTVYFEQVVEDPAKTLVFQEVFEYQSFAYYPKLDVARVEALPKDWGNSCLTERPPHIVFAPEIRQEVAAIVGNQTNPLVKAQRIFRWVSANIPWNAEDEYCIIPSFAIRAYSARRGDCGVQNTLFITMCRIAGIPARWQSGFETKPGEAWGMHDWAEIYIAPWGWLPADASYGIQPSSDPRVADFYCGHQDSYRLIVNLDWGRELFPPKNSLRSEPADFQRGEVEVDGQNLYFDEWESKSEVVR